MTETETIGQMVRDAREEQGITQAALAELVGRTHTMVSHIEAGRKEPSWETMIKLAEVLGLSLDDLVWKAGRLPGDVFQEMVSTKPALWIKFVREVTLARKRSEKKDKPFSWEDILLAGIEVMRRQTGVKV